MSASSLGHLVRNRRKELGLTQDELAGSLGVDASYITKIERGKRSPGLDLVVTMAETLGLPPDEVLSHTKHAHAYNAVFSKSVHHLRLAEAAPDYGPQVRERQIPVISHVSAGEPIECAWTDAGLPVGAGLDWAPAPPDGSVPDHMYSLRVRGTSMLPMIREGALIFVDPEAVVHNNDLVVAKDVEGRAWLKHVRLSGEMVILKSLNQQFEDILLPRSKVQFMHRVAWIKP